MKSMAWRFFPVVMGLGVTFDSLPAQTMPAERVPAVVVIRHGKDAEAWAPNTQKHEVKGADSETWFPSALWRKLTDESEGFESTWPEYNRAFYQIDKEGNRSPRVGNVKAAVHGLSGDWKTKGIDGTKVQPWGESQANKLGETLDGFLTSRNFQLVTRAISIDPTSPDATSNPFDTLWPLVFLSDRVGGRPRIDYDLVEISGRGTDWEKFPGIKKLIAEDKLLPGDGGSTIICWTGEGLGTLQEDQPGVVEQLTKKYLGSVVRKDWVDKSKIAKCADIFIFYGPEKPHGNGSVQHWYFDPSASPQYVFREEQPPRE